MRIRIPWHARLWFRLEQWLPTGLTSREYVGLLWLRLTEKRSPWPAKPKNRFLYIKIEQPRWRHAGCVTVRDGDEE